MNDPRKVSKVSLCSLISDNVTHKEHEATVSPNAIILGAQLDGMTVSLIVEDDVDNGESITRSFVFIRPNMEVPYNAKFIHLIQAAQLSGFIAVYELINPIKYEMPKPGERHNA